MYVGAKGEEGGRGNRWWNYAPNGGWVVFFFPLLTERGWRKGKEGGVLSPDVRQRVEKQCVPRRCLHLECVSAPQCSGPTGGDNKAATPPAMQHGEDTS